MLRTPSPVYHRTNGNGDDGGCDLNDRKKRSTRWTSPSLSRQKPKPTWPPVPSIDSDFVTDDSGTSIADSIADQPEPWLY